MITRCCRPCTDFEPSNAFFTFWLFQPRSRYIVVRLVVSTLIYTHTFNDKKFGSYLYIHKVKENQRNFAHQCSLWDPYIAIQLWPTSDLHLMYALASDDTEDIGRALGHNCLELGGALDEQESRKPERVDAQLLARQGRHGEHVRIVPSWEDILYMCPSVSNMLYTIARRVCSPPRGARSRCTARAD